MIIAKRYDQRGRLVKHSIDGLPQPIDPNEIFVPRLAVNALGAAFRVAKATMKGEKVRASQSEIEHRLAICRACEFFVDNPMKCRKCGCFLNLKTRLETEHCPIEKW